MRPMQLAVLLGGTPHQTDTSVCKVSYWHVPNGSDFERATAYAFYFDSEDAGRQFESRYQADPERALYEPLQAEKAQKQA